jgi:trk system potassium uptake protein TrkA
MQNKEGAAITIHSIADGQAEALEFLVDENTLHCDTPLKKLKLRPNVLLVGITSKNGIEIPSGDSVYHVGDSVVVVTSGEMVIGQFNDIFA